MEIWKTIESYPDYAVSNRGRIKRVTSSQRVAIGYIRKPVKNRGGYLQVTLYCSHPAGKKFQIHRLVLAAFVGPCQEGRECNHIDGDKTNNCVGNLEWVTPSQNTRHKFDVLGYQAARGEQQGMAKLTELQVRKIRDLSGCYPQYEIAEMFNVGKSTVEHVINRRTWKHVI